MTPPKQLERVKDNIEDETRKELESYGYTLIEIETVLQATGGSPQDVGIIAQKVISHGEDLQKILQWVEIVFAHISNLNTEIESLHKEIEELKN